jgi:hypothetical protein
VPVAPPVRPNIVVVLPPEHIPETELVAVPPAGVPEQGGGGVHVKARPDVGNIEEDNVAVAVFTVPEVVEDQFVVVDLFE